MPTKKAIHDQMANIVAVADFGNDYTLRSKFTKFVNQHKTNDITVDELVVELRDGGYRIDAGKEEHIRKQLSKTFKVEPARGASVAPAKPAPKVTMHVKAEPPSPKAKAPAQVSSSKQVSVGHSESIIKSTMQLINEAAGMKLKQLNKEAPHPGKVDSIEKFIEADLKSTRAIISKEAAQFRGTQDQFREKMFERVVQEEERLKASIEKEWKKVVAQSQERQAPVAAPAPALKPNQAKPAQVNLHMPASTKPEVKLPPEFDINEGLPEALREKPKVTEKPVVMHVERKPEPVAKQAAPAPASVRQPQVKKPVTIHVEQKPKAAAQPAQTSVLTPDAKPSDQIKVLRRGGALTIDNKYLKPFVSGLKKLVNDEKSPGEIMQVIESARTTVEKMDNLRSIGDMIPLIAASLSLKNDEVLNALKVAYGDKTQDQGKENAQPSKYRESITRITEAGPKRG